MNNNVKYQIVGANKTKQGWEFIAEPVGYTIKFLCTNPDTEILAWSVLHENLECILRFDDSGNVDLIGIPTGN